MSKIDYHKLARDMRLDEGSTSPDIFGYTQALSEILSRLSPKSMREKRDLDIARTHIKEIKRSARRLTEQVSTLEEQLRVLEEGKE